MAKFFEAKTASGVKTYSFAPDVVDGDSIESFTPTASGVSVDASEQLGETIQFTLSGGTAGQTGSLSVSVVTVGGETLNETIYIPIIDSAAQIAATARDYIGFALRKVAGVGSIVEAEELDDALERLSALIAEWRECGADIGAPFPLTANSVIYCPDWAAPALRYNLLIDCASLYGEAPTPMELERARRGVQLVKSKGLPDQRESEFF